MKEDQRAITEGFSAAVIYLDRGNHAQIVHRGGLKCFCFFLFFCFVFGV
jgi:hypothetical protein